MTQELYDFLGELAANNDRPWFQAHKARYEALRGQWIEEVDRLIAAMAPDAPELAWLSGRECTYRIYRDTRFSPDKTPYKTYISSLLSPGGRKSDMAAYYISAGVAEGDNGMFGGLWCPDASALRKMRHAIVDNIEEFEEIIHNPALARVFPEWIGPTLKTIPKGWPRDHAQAPLLRLLHYGREHLVGREFFLDSAWPERAAEMLLTLRPLNQFINYTLFEEE